LAQHFLAGKGIIAIRRAKKSDMEKLAKATGGNIVTKLDDIRQQISATPHWWKNAK